jgi:DnaJ family protein C protein 22
MYKELVKKWHPDKEKDPAKKLEAQEKFIEIQQAYDTLSKIKTKRAHRNKKSRKHEHTEF